MKVRLLAPARQELDDAVAWYNEQTPGLGREFLMDGQTLVVVAVAHLHRAPRYWADRS